MLLKPPKIEITELKQDSIKFILTDADLRFFLSIRELLIRSLANALRRIMIAEVPTIGRHVHT